MKHVPGLKKSKKAYLISMELIIALAIGIFKYLNEQNKNKCSGEDVDYEAMVINSKLDTESYVTLDTTFNKNYNFKDYE